MSGQGFDLGALKDVLSSLGAEDTAALQELAASVFSGDGQSAPTDGQTKTEAQTPPSFGGPDLESILKLASVLELLQSEQSDPRTQLLAALRPLLNESRRPKVDQAVRMLRLFSLLPKIKELGLF